VTWPLNPPLLPRNGRELQILLVCRVSSPGPGKQDIRSLDDQQAMLTAWLREQTDQPFHLEVLAGSGSGEHLERREYRELLDRIQREPLDAILTEDLGRIARRIMAYQVCELCAERDIRLIAINDGVDTAGEGWEDRSIFSAWHHERSNRDTSRRIKRTLQNRFETSGGCLPGLIYGYRRPPNAKSDADVEKVAEAQAVYDEWLDRLDRGQSYSQVADWLNERGIPTGPSARKRTWDGKMVARVIHNPILKGWRYRNKLKTRRTASGKYQSVKANPDETLWRHVPHLAFFDPDCYDRVIAKLEARNAKYTRQDKNGHDPRRRVPKKRTRFPGQAMYCGICGHMFVFGGHGQTDHLMCDGARNYQCWNGVTVDGPLAARKISEAVFSEIAKLENFDAAMLDYINEEARKKDGTREERLRQLDGRLAKNVRERGNLVKFIREGGDSPTIREELCRLDDENGELVREREALQREPSDIVELPSVEMLKQLMADKFRDLAIESFEFADALRALTCPIYVFPYQCCLGGKVVLRAKFSLRLAQLLPSEHARDALDEVLQRVLVVDLFEPPQPVAHREKVLKERFERSKTEREVAQVLGITTTAAQRAVALQRLMDQLDIQDPYQPVREPPESSKLRRHLHPRYRFEPIADHEPDWP